MAHVPFKISALAATLLLTVSPIASAEQTDAPTQPSQPIAVQSANMLEMNLCGERDQVIAELEEVFSETPMAIGQVDGNAVVEILVSESGTWTILATGTDGLSCIVSAGEGFQSTTLVRGVDA